LPAEIPFSPRVKNTKHLAIFYRVTKTAWRPFNGCANVAPVDEVEERG